MYCLIVLPFCQLNTHISIYRIDRKDYLSAVLEFGIPEQVCADRETGKSVLKPEQAEWLDV